MGRQSDPVGPVLRNGFIKKFTMEGRHLHLLSIKIEIEQFRLNLPRLVSYDSIGPSRAETSSPSTFSIFPLHSNLAQTITQREDQNLSPTIVELYNKVG